MPVHLPLFLICYWSGPLSQGDRDNHVGDVHFDEVADLAILHRYPSGAGPGSPRDPPETCRGRTETAPRLGQKQRLDGTKPWDKTVGQNRGTNRGASAI